MIASNILIARTNSTPTQTETRQPQTADDTPAHQESVRFLTTDVMRSFNSTMAEDNYNTSQSNLAERQRLQQSNEELAAAADQQAQLEQQSRQAGSAPPPSGARTTRIADEMSQDLQYLSREAPLDGGESTFGGAYSTLGGSRHEQPAAAASHHSTYSSTTITRTSTPGGADDYEQQHRLETPPGADFERTDFRIDGDDDATQVYNYNQQMHSAAGAAAANQQQLEQLAPDNVEIQRPLQQTGSPPLDDKFELQLARQSRAQIDSGQLDNGPLASRRAVEPLESAAAWQFELADQRRGEQQEAGASGGPFVGSLPLKPFLVSFMVDARGGAMRGCRHSGVRVIIPANSAQQPMRITCRYLRRERLVHPPPLMEGEACASKIMEVGPAGARFLGPVLIEVPHFASLRGKEREIIILRSDSGEIWREHLAEPDEQQAADAIVRSAELAEQQQRQQEDQENQRPDSAMGQSVALGGGGDSAAQQERRLTRIVTNEFPQYFAIISRIRQEVHPVGPEGSLVDSQVVPKVQAIFTEGALTKRIKIGLQKKNQDENSRENLNTEQQQDAAAAAERERARSPSTGRPGSAAAKRKSRFLACFGASHGSHDLLDQTADASNESSGASTGGDSPRQRPLAKEKPCERRHILEDVSDSEADSSSLEARASQRALSSATANRKRSLLSNQLVPDDYYIEPEPALILNVRPKTYGKRMASSSAQTDQKLPASGCLSTSATKDSKTRRGVSLLGAGRRRRNKTQMQIPFHEPQSQLGGAEKSSSQTRPKSADLGASSGSQPDSSLESQPAGELADEEQLMKCSLNDLTRGPDLDPHHKWRTCTIQTDSDSVTVQYVTIASLGEGAVAAAAATQTGHDDGYVSGSGELKKAHKTGASLFSPFCTSAKSDDDDAAADAELAAAERLANLEDSSLEDQQAAEWTSKQKKKMRQQKQQKKKKQNDKKAKSIGAGSGKSTPSAEPSKLSVVVEAKTPEPDDLQQVSLAEGEPAAGSKRSSLLPDASQTDQPESLGSEGAAAGTATNDESLISTTTSVSRSASPTSKELKQRLKLEKQEKAKREKQEKQKQKELEEATAKAEKARRKAEKEANKKAERVEKSALKSSASPADSRPQSPDSSPTAADDSNASAGVLSIITKTIQSVKFAPSPSKSTDERDQQQQTSGALQVDEKTEAESEPTPEGEQSTCERLESARKSPTSKLLDSMKFKVKLPKLSGGKRSSAGEAADGAQKSAGQPDESRSQQLISFSSDTESQPAPKEPPTGDQAKALRPILKQHSAGSFEQEPAVAPEDDLKRERSLESFADEMVQELTQDAIRLVDSAGELQVESSKQQACSPLTSPSASSSESKKEAKRLKAELKAKLEEQKRLTHAAEKMARLAASSARRAEREAKKVAVGAQQEAERQAKIAGEEAERAIKQSQEESPEVSASASLAPPQESASELKRHMKEAEAETKRLAKEAELEAKRVAKATKAEAERLAKETKSMLKLEKKQKRQKVEPSAPPAPVESSPDEQAELVQETSPRPAGLEGQREDVSARDEAEVVAESSQDVAEEPTPTAEVSSSRGKDKKSKSKSKKRQKRDPKKSAAERSSVSSAESHPTETSSKSSFFSRLFKSKRRAKTQQSAAGDDKSLITTAVAIEEFVETPAGQQHDHQRQLIVSEMYPSDPNDADGEMILEVNVPEELMSGAHKVQQQQQPPSEDSQLFQTLDRDSAARAVSQLVDSSIVTSASTVAEPTDDQEATLVNLSQMVDDVNDEADDDQATENVISQHSNEDLAAAALGPPPPSRAELAERGLDSEDAQQLQPSQGLQAAEGEEPATRQQLEPITSAAPLQLQDEKARRELETKLDKESKRRAKEEEKQRKKQEKLDKKRAELESKKQAQEAKERHKREAKEAKQLAKLAKEEANREKLKREQEAKLEKKQKKSGGETLAASSSAAEQLAADSSKPDEQRPTTISTTTVTSTTTTTGDERSLSPNMDGADRLESGARVLMSTSSEVPINEETELERIVEETVGADGTVTKTTKTIETKYVTMRQEEVRVAERRDMPLEEWQRIQAARAEAHGQASSSRALDAQLAPASPELAEIRATPSYFDPQQLPAEIKAETSAKKAQRKRIKLNQRLIKRAYKLAKSEAKEAKRSQHRAEAEIAVCDEAARQARKELKRAVRELEKAVKEAEKQHKKMDKMDKKLEKRAKKLEKRQKKLDKRLAKRAKKQAKQAEKEAKAAAKARAAGPSRSPSRGSKKSIKLEDIGEPVLRSSSRLSIVQNNPNVELSEQQVVPSGQVSAQIECPHRQSGGAQTDAAGETEPGQPLGVPAEGSGAMQQELEAVRDEVDEIMIDVVAETEASPLDSSSSPESNSRDRSEEKDNCGEAGGEVEATTPASSAPVESKRNKKKNKRQKSKETAS